jgi:L-glutamine-phosphate cytidylyltransferase
MQIRVGDKVQIPGPGYRTDGRRCRIAELPGSNGEPRSVAPSVGEDEDPLSVAPEGAGVEPPPTAYRPTLAPTRMNTRQPETDSAPISTAVLLAAGLGSRLAPLTDVRPKCLLPVGGVPILERLVDCLDGYRFERLVIVTGYKAVAIHDYLGKRFGGINVEYVASPLFETTNNIYSLWLARDLVDEPFVLVESDLVFDAELLGPLLRPDRIAVSRQLPWMSGTTVTLDGEGNVKAFYTAPPGVYGQHCTDVDHLMAVNVCSLSRDTWEEVRKRLDQHVAAGQTGFFYELVFEEMTADGFMSPKAVVFPTDRWYEIDTPADLHAAELMFPRLRRLAGDPGRRILGAGVAV